MGRLLEGSAYRGFYGIFAHCLYGHCNVHLLFVKIIWVFVFDYDLSPETKILYFLKYRIILVNSRAKSFLEVCDHLTFFISFVIFGF